MRTDLLEPDGGVAHSPSRGDGADFTVRAGGKVAPARLRYDDSPIEELRDLIRFDWDAMDAWFEEDEEVFTHPRDPHTRVDILPARATCGSRSTASTVAESTSPRLLFETGLPPRYYLPKTDVRMDLLTPTDTREPLPVQGPGRVLVGRAGDSVPRTSRGRTARRCPRARRSPAWSPSTTRRSTSTSTACGRSAPTPSSA